MEEQDQLTDRALISGLLDLGNELLIKGDAPNAWICTQAVARLLAIPQVATAVQHPAKVDPIAAVVDEILNYHKREA